MNIARRKDQRFMNRALCTAHIANRGARDVRRGVRVGIVEFEKQGKHAKTKTRRAKRWRAKTCKPQKGQHSHHKTGKRGWKPSGQNLPGNDFVVNSQAAQMPRFQHVRGPGPSRWRRSSYRRRHFTLRPLFWWRELIVAGFFRFFLYELGRQRALLLPGAPKYEFPDSI